LLYLCVCFCVIIYKLLLGLLFVGLYGSNFVFIAVQKHVLFFGF
jgi:hypothetical protein